MLKRWLEQLCQANARKTLENHTGTIKTEQGTMCGCDVFLLFFYTICKGVPFAKLMILMDFMENCKWTVDTFFDASPLFFYVVSLLWLL